MVPQGRSELSPSLPWLRPPLQMFLPAVFADYLHICMHAHSALYFIPILLIYRTLRITRSTCQQHVASYIYHTYDTCAHTYYTQHCNYTHLICSTICTPLIHSNVHTSPTTCNSTCNSSAILALAATRQLPATSQPPGHDATCRPRMVKIP